MFARSYLAPGFLLLSLVAVGCKTESTPTPAQPAQSLSTPQSAAGISQSSAVPQPVPDQPAEPDDATLLARKTSEYASNISRVLAQHPAVPASRPSIVQWSDPEKRPPNSDISQNNSSASAGANQSATLAAVHLKEDTAVPLILPESADQISSPPAQAPSAESPAPPVTIPTDEYELKLRKMVRDYPRDLGSQLDYQLLRLVRDEPTPDLAEVTQLSPEDRDLVIALMDGLANFRATAHNDGNVMLNRKIQPLIEMAERLRSQGQLSIPTVAFCSQVKSYGDYRPMASSRFPAGRENELIVYSEAANFTSIQGNDSMWRTRLRQEMVLYTDTGLAVWPDKSNTIDYLDQSHARRHDFFIPRFIQLPSSLAAGKYVLKITLTDVQSNRVAEASSPLEIVSASAAIDAQPAADHDTPDPTALSP